MNMAAIVQLSDIVTDLLNFEQKISTLASRLGIRLSKQHIDHISLRCHQISTAERWFDGLQLCGRCVNKTSINGRPIALFLLDEPLQLAGVDIDCVELPWPGERRYPHEGWEHIEIVLPGGPVDFHVRALAVVNDRALTATDIRIKQSLPQGQGETLVNPTLAVSDKAVTIKFHPWRLLDIVASENFRSVDHRPEG